MPAKLNSYILPDKIIQKMRSDVEDTKKMGLEIGFNLCIKDTTEELQDEKRCVGSSCKLTGWKPGCQSKGKHVGIFHTHPMVPKISKGYTSPSMSDLIGAYQYGIMCIGGAGDNKIQCSIRKDKEADIKTILSIRADVEMYEKPLRQKHHITTIKDYDAYMAKRRDAQYVKNKLHDGLFNIIDIQ
jgi:hypothetical protein